jgi:predicted acyltransferase (DUF342 family)
MYIITKKNELIRYNKVKNVYEFCTDIIIDDDIEIILSDSRKKLFGKEITPKLVIKGDIRAKSLATDVNIEVTGSVELNDGDLIAEKGIIVREGLIILNGSAFVGDNLFAKERIYINGNLKYVPYGELYSEVILLSKNVTIVGNTYIQMADKR